MRISNFMIFILLFYLFAEIKICHFEINYESEKVYFRDFNEISIECSINGSSELIWTFHHQILESNDKIVVDYRNDTISGSYIFTATMRILYLCPTDYGSYLCKIPMAKFELKKISYISREKNNLVFKMIGNNCSDFITLICEMTYIQLNTTFYIYDQTSKSKLKEVLLDNIFDTCSNRTIYYPKHNILIIKVNKTFIGTTIYNCVLNENFHNNIQSLEVIYGPCSYKYLNILVILVVPGVLLILLLLFCFSNKFNTKRKFNNIALQTIPQNNYSDSINIIKCIGNGEYGKVYLGTMIMESIEINVAVKILKKPTYYSVQNFIQELTIMKNIKDSKYIVKYYDCEICADGIKIVMEYLPKGSLLNFLQTVAVTKETNERELCQFSIDIAKGMDYLSSINIIHRDLASRNILVSEDNSLKISDFGLSRDTNEYYKQKSNAKVPIRWLSFESLLYKKYTSYSDIWSYGILLYEIYTLGSVPYPDIQDISNLPNLIKHGYRNSRPGYAHRDIYDIMMKTWHETPTLRPLFSKIVVLLESILEKCSLTLIDYFQ